MYMTHWLNKEIQTHDGRPQSSTDQPYLPYFHITHTVVNRKKLLIIGINMVQENTKVKFIIKIKFAFL